MNTYRNTEFVKRDYECTNVVACVADQAPAAHWERCSDDVLRDLTPLYRQAGVAYYGHL